MERKSVRNSVLHDWVSSLFSMLGGSLSDFSCHEYLAICVNKIVASLHRVPPDGTCIGHDHYQRSIEWHAVGIYRRESANYRLGNENFFHLEDGDNSFSLSIFPTIFHTKTIFKHTKHNTHTHTHSLSPLSTLSTLSLSVCLSVCLCVGVCVCVCLFVSWVLGDCFCEC